MYERSFPKELEVKKELIRKIEERFEFKFPPLYKLLILNFNTSIYNFYPTIDKWFKNSGLELDIYMSDKKHEDFPFNGINSPLRIYNDLMHFSFVKNTLLNFDRLAIGNFDSATLYVGVGEENQDVVFYHTIENEKLIPQKLENNIFHFISKYKITLPLGSENMERGILEKYWLDKNEEIFLDMKKFHPIDHKENYIELDNLVDIIYKEIIDYVQS